MEKGELNVNESSAVIDSLKKDIEVLKQAIASNTGSSTKDIASDIAKALRSVDDLQNGRTKFFDADELDPDDYIPDGILFTAYSSMYLIVDDKRNGKSVLAPNGEKIIFNTLHSKTVKEGNEQRVQYICGYICRSKKIALWLRSHSLFGIHFFEGTDKSLSVDARKAFFAAKAANMVNSYSKTQLIESARQYGLSLGSDLSVVRQELIHKIADNDYNTELKYYESRKL